MLLANVAIAAFTELDTPCPAETNKITAPTPMINPSMVNVERSLLARNARIAMSTVSRKIISAPHPPTRTSSPRNAAKIHLRTTVVNRAGNSTRRRIDPQDGEVRSG
jgi:hypothetical protein